MLMDTLLLSFIGQAAEGCRRPEINKYVLKRISQGEMHGVVRILFLEVESAGI